MLGETLAKLRSAQVASESSLGPAPSSQMAQRVRIMPGGVVQAVMPAHKDEGEGSRSKLRRDVSSVRREKGGTVSLVSELVRDGVVRHHDYAYLSTPEPPPFSKNATAGSSANLLSSLSAPDLKLNGMRRAPSTLAVMRTLAASNSPRSADGASEPLGPLLNAPSFKSASLLTSSPSFTRPQAS